MVTKVAPLPRKMTGYSKADWSKIKQGKFLAVLADTANVTASAKAIKFKEAAAYDFRRKSAVFRAAWNEALSEGYAKLELMMLERAMKALRPDTADEPADAVRTRVEDYSNKLAMGLLAAHRATVRGDRVATSTLARSGNVRGRFEARFAAVQTKGVDNGTTTPPEE